MSDVPPRRTLGDALRRAQLTDPATVVLPGSPTAAERARAKYGPHTMRSDKRCAAGCGAWPCNAAVNAATAGGIW
jgi:hypothetical protein